VDKNQQNHYSCCFNAIFYSPYFFV